MSKQANRLIGDMFVHCMDWKSYSFYSKYICGVRNGFYTIYRYIAHRLQLD